jgi:hypothetical protein
MPYWSSPRVGAIPQGTFTKTNNGNKKKELHQRKKGITMEVSIVREAFSQTDRAITWVLERV